MGWRIRVSCIGEEEGKGDHEKGNRVELMRKAKKHVQYRGRRGEEENTT